MTIAVMLTLTTGALILIRLHWPLRLPVAPGSAGWDDDGVPVRPPTNADGRAVARADRWRWAGLLAGAAGAAVAIAASESVRGAMIAAPVFVGGVLAGAFAGELWTPAQAGQVRRAELRIRRYLDYVPPTLGVLVSVAAVVLFALATFTTMEGAARGWNATSRRSGCGAGEVLPVPEWLWPGAYYTVPGLFVVLGGLTLAGLALRRVVRRPRSTDVFHVDDVSRRRSAEVVTAAAGVIVLVPLMGVAAAAGMAMVSLAGVCGEPSWASAGPALSALALAAFVAAAWCGAYLVLPSARPAPGGTA
ncbi:hypothetical protein [Actinoplanes sp. NPDC026623]|uniref:hypothetical protein n=1 Tax=Actinoplanes sp. NPDC026623 TaxID=3155610 RepID=UPI0033BFC784